MNIEQLCGLNDSVIRHKDIEKIIKYENRFFGGLIIQIRIKVICKNEVCFYDFVPSDVEGFIEKLKQRCPDAEYI